nr:MAG TPA: hypothetical protein [Caudoviricetes sp.]
MIDFSIFFTYCIVNILIKVFMVMMVQIIIDNY